MKKKNLTLGLAVVAASAASLGLTACDADTVAAVLDIVDNLFVIDGKGNGWLENDEKPEEIEDDIVVNPVTDDDRVNVLPSRVDLSKNLPPIGDQGQFGTCVSWATAYNGRTYLNARAKGLTTSQLNETNTFSAGDMFRVTEGRGKQCGGSNFEPALDKLVSRGVATMANGQTISSFADCDCAPSASANSDAAKYKIKNYREIDIKDVKTVKRYLNDGRVVIFGAQLGDNFMRCSNGTVIRSHGGFTSTGQHAYHAIVCCGYDDDKNAFRVVNSWGPSWGDRGFCWVDYDFFTKGDATGQFVFCGFVMYSLDEEVKQLAATSNSQLDVMPLGCADVDYDEPDDPDSANPAWRTLFYDVYNAGTATVRASDSWAVCYMLYNAFDASDYEIVLFDYYTDKLNGVADVDDMGNWDADDAFDILGIKSQGYAVYDLDLAPQQSLAVAMTGDEEAIFSWPYKLPNVSGKYYLVLMADAFGSLDESNKDNNFYFLTTADGQPLTIENGVIKDRIANNKSLQMRAAKPKQNAQLPGQTAVTPQNLNTYTPAEIAGLIQNARKSGELRNKALRWQADNGNRVKARRISK